MSGIDLFDLIYKYYCNNDLSETVIEVNDLLHDIKINNKSLTFQIEEYMHEICIDSNLCPLCGNKLIVTSHEEEREYQGFICTEKIYSVQCSDPGCSYDNE